MCASTNQEVFTVAGQCDNEQCRSCDSNYCGSPFHDLPNEVDFVDNCSFHNCGSNSRSSSSGGGSSGSDS